MSFAKLSKLALFAIITVPVIAYFGGCSSDDNGGTTDGGFNAEPTDGITGVWQGTLTRPDTKGLPPEEYNFGMMFYMPDGATRGTSVGYAFRVDPPAYPENMDVEPHFLIKSGYEVVTGVTNQDGDLVCDGWGVGRFGITATFLREFSYETGSQAGPDQRGAMCLQQDGNKLTGEFKTEAYGTFLVDLTYSAANTRVTSVNDLISGGVDSELYNLWSNDNTGSTMSFSQILPITGNIIDVRVTETSTSFCWSDVRIVQIPGYNMYTLETMFPHVLGCNYTEPVGNPDFYSVDLRYKGLGTIVDVNGTMAFLQIMGSEDNIDSAQALYNVFTIQ
jgi:hypothetical protein